MIKLKEYIDEFKKGYQTHSKVREIAKKYGKGCEQSAKELDEAGIPYSEWDFRTCPLKILHIRWVGRPSG